MGDERYDEIMMPVSLALADRCDACLRIGGASKGADDEVERFKAAGKPVYRRLDEIQVHVPCRRINIHENRHCPA